VVNGRRLFVAFVSFDDILKRVRELRELTRMNAACSERTAFLRGYPPPEWRRSFAVVGEGAGGRMSALDSFTFDSFDDI
jgi:hypothetical protein